MASYRKNSFTITLQDYALNRGKTPANFSIDTLVVREPTWKGAVKRFDEAAKPYEAVLGVQEGITNIPYTLIGSQIGNSYYMIRGTGVKAK